MFIDQAKIQVKAGRGGKGCQSFSRETRARRGKPNGGAGGDGGDIILRADKEIYTLLDFYFQKHFKAESGKHGSSNKKQGARGDDKVVFVPVGTVITDAATGYLMKDLNRHGDDLLVVRGGRGGYGNSRNRDAQEGTPGEEKELLLDLKVIADVGIIGFPNAGKSTLISKISNATPKIAPYPFTTKAPVLGVITSSEADPEVIIADLPGLVEGAHKGKGLGDRFLRHAERTKILLHLIDMAATDGRDPYEAYQFINAELKAYAKTLVLKEQIVVANKMDVKAAEKNYAAFVKKFKGRVFEIAALQSKGLEVLVEEIIKKVSEDRH